MLFMLVFVSFLFPSFLCFPLQAASARVRAKMAEERSSGGAEAMAPEVWGEVEPMEVLEGQSEPLSGAGVDRSMEEKYAVLHDPERPDLR